MHACTVPLVCSCNHLAIYKSNLRNFMQDTDCVSTSSPSAIRSAQTAEAARDALQARLDKAEKLSPQLSQAQAELAAAQASLSMVGIPFQGVECEAAARGTVCAAGTHAAEALQLPCRAQ